VRKKKAKIHTKRTAKHDHHIHKWGRALLAVTTFFIFFFVTYALININNQDTNSSSEASGMAPASSLNGLPSETPPYGYSGQ
jgi:hypothetical protein